MKKICLYALSTILTLSLNARENPFEATNAYEEEVAKIVDSAESKTPDSIQEAGYISEMQKKMEKAVQKTRDEEKSLEKEHKVVKKVETKKTEPKKEKVYTKKEVDTLIKRTEKKTKDIVKKELANAKPVEVVYVKPRTDIGKDEEPVKMIEGMIKKQVLPFVSLEYGDDKLIIDTKYKIAKKFTADREYKLVMDFKGKVNFSTSRQKLDTKNFKVVSFGNHENEGFFRVVVQFEEHPSKYNVEFGEEKITITKK